LDLRPLAWHHAARLSLHRRRAQPSLLQM
jgi:hypothetical protein